MISVILYGRNDSYGYNLHKRGAISFNCIAEVLNHPDDEIIFVDTNTPDDLPTFPEAIRDTLTARAKKLLRILRVRPASYEKFKNGTRMKVLEPLCRNVGIRRANPRNHWVLNSNTDMVFVPLKPGQSLSEAVADLPDGLYELPRFEMPEMLWESLDRGNPQVIMERFAHWGRRLHVNESVLSGHENIFDAPGDFQLAPRKQLFAIHGMNEQMVLGWHVDSNLCRRFFLLNGRNYSLLERCHAYHCDHTRVNTMMHTAEGGTANDWRVFCTNVTTPYIPEQAKTWGMPNEPVEEIRLTDEQGNRYPTVLERLLPGMQKPMLQSALNGESYNDGLFYDNQHVLPYLTDHLGQIPPTADIGYFGGNAELLKLMAEFRLGFGHTGQVLYDANALETGGAKPTTLPGNCAAMDFEGISKRAFVFCLDLWMGNFPALKNRFGYRTITPSNEAAQFCALMMRRLFELARLEKTRFDADPHQARKFILMGTQHAWVGNAVGQLINVVLTPYSSYVRHGVVRKDAFTKMFEAVPSHYLFLGDDPAEIQKSVENSVGRSLRQFDFAHAWLHGDAVRCGVLDLDSDCARNVLLRNDVGRAVLRIQSRLAEIDGLVAIGKQMQQAVENAANIEACGVDAAPPAPAQPAASASVRVLAGTPTIGIDIRNLGATTAASSRSGRYTQLHIQHLISSRPNWNFQLYLDSATHPPAVDALLALPNAKLCRFSDYRPGDIDLFHVPDPFHRAPGLRSPLELITDVRASAMVFDLSYLRFDQEEAKVAGILEDIQRLAQLLEPRFRVLTLSEFTRCEFLKATGCAEDKATAVHSGLYPVANPKITPAAIRAVRQKYGLKNRMLLHFGPMERGNNFESAITAFGQLRASDLDLVVVGERNDTVNELAALVQGRNLGIIFPGVIPDADLELLYHEAVALVCLSSRADYSFQVLEAMAQGCPVVAARKACFTELGGEAALLFAPDDIKGIAGSLGQLLSSAPWRRELADKGRARASQFTWEATAQKTIAVWEEMLAGATKVETEAGRAKLPLSQSSSGPAQPGSPGGSPYQVPDPKVRLQNIDAPIVSQTKPAGESIAVAWEGSYLDFGSLSYVNRELTKELQHHPGVALTRVVSVMPANIHPKLEKLGRELALAAPPATQLTVRHGWPPNWSRPASGALVVMQPWEFGALPEEWVRESSAVQAFWVPTEFVRQAFIQSGVPAAKVQVVPNGINPAVFHPGARPLKLATAKSFKFLFVGGTIHRKGADVLLEAYLRSFSAKDDVCLVIKDFGTKSFYAGQTLGERIRAVQATPGTPEILYLDGELAPDELPGLYTACDCLAHPYRGEGFGLTILEAMACGLPAIITAGGAADEFAGKFAYSVKATRKSIGQSIGGAKLTGPGWLLEPDPTALAEQMKHVFANREEARAKGRQAGEHARRDWTWERAAVVAAERLQALQKQSASEHAEVNVAPVAVVDSNQSATAKTASKVPACALVGQLGRALGLFQSKKLADAWAATLSALQERPFHPEAFLLLAEIALAAGDSSSARLCAQRASDMAPQCPAALRFLRSKLRGNAKPEWLTLPESLSGQVKPRLSLCMIVKNEEQFLGQCLNSVRGLVDQIIVVDTGSTDRTVEIAREHGAEVHPFQWCDDFSAARNAALEHARGDWVLVLDADEELPPDQHEALRKLMSCREVIAWRLPIAEVGREQESHAYVPRLFRNAPALFYVSRVHEQVFGSIELRRREWGLDNRLGDAALRHHGYRPEIMQDRKKVERNLRLLERALEEYPSEPFLLMNYGLELIRSGQPTKGLESYRKAFEVMSVEEPPETREMLLAQYSTHLMRAEQFEQVVRVLESPLAKAGELNASLHFTLGLAHLKLKQSREAAVQMRQCLEKRHLPSLSSVNKDIHTVAPRYCLALALDQLGETANAALEFERAMAEDPKSRPVRLDYARFLAAHGKAADAIKLLYQMTVEKPDDVAVWAHGGRLALSKPEFLEVARNWTAEARRRAPQDPVILRQRAEALLLSGQCDAALPLWRQLQASSDPASLAALVICETIVGQSQECPDPELEARTSHEFLKLYRRLVTYKAQAVLGELNARLEQWQNQLPTAARALSAALAEAQEPVAA